MQIYHVSVDELIGNKQINFNNQPIIPNNKIETVETLLKLPENIYNYIAGQIEASAKLAEIKK